MKKKAIITAVAVLLAAGAVAGIVVWRGIFGPGISVGADGSAIVIPAGAGYPQVLDSIKKNLHVRNIRLLDLVARKKRYPELVKPGYYAFDRDISINALINILRSGRQTPVRITFNNIRTLSQIAGKIGGRIAADSAAIMEFLSDEANYAADGFKKETIIAVFIPDTYELYRTTDAKGLYTRMLREYRAFWNSSRKEKADGKGLSPLEVSILASIIDDEVVKPDEKPRIAGVYINRLRRGIPLQACPTIKFALNDWTITRVLYKQLETDSPYNTYKYQGFPPGPIGCPSIEGIDAVLNAEEHDYLFFVAKADFSGYHNFSRTLAEHNHYAAIYQRELNKRKIFR